jgi:hypothetical protein
VRALSVNVNKTKELMDFRKKQMEHPPIHIEGTAVDKVERLKYLDITDNLKWSTTDVLELLYQGHQTVKWPLLASYHPVTQPRTFEAAALYT